MMERHSERTGEDPKVAESLWIDRHLLPAIRDPALLVLVLVMVGHIVAFVAPTLVFAVRDRSMPALFALVLIVVLTAECVRFELGRGRRPTLSAILAGMWIVAGATAWAAHHYGFF